MTRSLLAALLVASSGCAQIETRSTVAVEPVPNAQPLRIGEGRKQVGQSVAATWSQASSTIEIGLTEHRRCRAVEHRPVERVETLDHTVKNGGLYWEYGTGAAILALGIAALAKPEAFSPSAIDTDGNTVRDTSTGVRIGAVFTALGAAIVGVAVYDTVRSRDEVIRTPAYQVALADEVPCLAPKVPGTAQEITLAIGPWTAKSTTDGNGVARFELPKEAALGVEFPPPPVSAEQSRVKSRLGGIELPFITEPPPPKPVEVDATVTVGSTVGRFRIVAPLADATAANRSGPLDLAAQTSSPPSPRSP